MFFFVYFFKFFICFETGRRLRARRNTIIFWLKPGQHSESILQVLPYSKEQDICCTSVHGLDCSCQQTNMQFRWHAQENKPRIFHKSHHNPMENALPSWSRIIHQYLNIDLVYVKLKFRFVSLHSSVSSLYRTHQTGKKSFFVGICIQPKNSASGLPNTFSPPQYVCWTIPWKLPKINKISV